MENSIRIVNKKTGQTPLECINEIKKAEPNLAYLPLTYAGRLDPLAEGVLIVLIGDECLKKDEYLKLEKIYELEILFGFATDTYDVMGKIINIYASSSCQFLGPRTREDEGPDHKNWHEDSASNTNILNSTPDYVSRIEEILPNFIGKIKQSYPPYSSRPVNGKPLFMWAREGKLDQIEIPTHNVQIDNIEIIGENSYLGAQLLSKIKEDIGKVKGDFRQKEIISIWEKELQNKKEEKYFTIKLRINCGSGVYVRSIANEIGEKLGIPTLALRIVRTKVGEYGIN
jgi:tRNA pseudouridine55 synthase